MSDKVKIPEMPIDWVFQSPGGPLLRVENAGEPGLIFCDDCHFGETCNRDDSHSCMSMVRRDQASVIYRRVPSQLDAVRERVEECITITHDLRLGLENCRWQKLLAIINTLTDTPTETTEPTLTGLSAGEVAAAWTDAASMEAYGRQDIASLYRKVLTVLTGRNAEVTPAETTEVEALKRELTDMRSLLPDLGAAIEATELRLTERDAEVENLKRELAAANRRGDNYRDHLTLSEADVANTKRQLADSQRNYESAIQLGSCEGEQAEQTAHAAGVAEVVAWVRKRQSGWAEGSDPYCCDGYILEKFAPEPEPETMNHAEAMLAVFDGTGKRAHSVDWFDGSVVGVAEDGILTLYDKEGGMHGYLTMKPDLTTRWIIIESEASDE